MKWDVVFFDFDGVILDSVDVKTKAFAQMFRKYGPDVEKKVIEYHLANGGVSRFEKFRYFYEIILSKPINEEIINRLSKQFSNLVVVGVINSPFVNGAKESLETLRKNNIPAYVISGTPDKEIKLIVERKGLTSYFKGVYGSPRKKNEICREIMKREQYAPQKGLFLGDAMSDYEAAQKNGLYFLGIIKDKKNIPFPNDTTVSANVTLLFESIH